MTSEEPKAPEVMESIEAKGPDEDVEMQDADGDADADAEADADADADADGDADADADGDVDADGELEDALGEAPESRADRDPSDILTIMTSLESFIRNYRNEDGEEISQPFQRIPNRRTIPDYYDVIKNPVAFSTVRNKISKKLYNNFPEFVRDVAQIFHNAQVYNRPSSLIFGWAVTLRNAFKEELKKHVTEGSLAAAETELPDLGEIPEAEDSPPVEAEEEEVEEEEDDEDEDEEEEDSDDEGGRRRSSRRRNRASMSGKGSKLDGKDDDGPKRRGRPPKVLTPMEARIHAVLRGLRRPKDEDGELLILPFEKLPDKQANPEYYKAITNPMALDTIKKKAKRKKYRNVDDVLKDIELMFDNAKRYNEKGSEIYNAAIELQKEARTLAQQENAKPDDDFRDEDGKLPLAGIDYNGQTWKVGDWVHIRNPNDLQKPIVAQIYRTWQDSAGQKWINACWYYRPEQTVHRYEKHFFEHEVVKTGQYRDHQIDEVLDRCFVMFVTRFNKGRPRGFPPDKDVYVCESRYNEEKCTFNKIKTWASCVPDEVREKDYEMDLFDKPRRLRKMPSPIKHLLRADAKPTDDLPKPTWRHANAPPVIGAVHCRPREENESPPPEPTPPPPPTPPPIDHSDAARRPSVLQPARDLSSDMSAGTPTPYLAQVAPAASPSPAPYGQQFASHFTPATASPVPLPPQTPVPIPQPHLQPAHSQVPIRPMHYPPQGYPPNYSPGFAPSSTASQHHASPAGPNYDGHHRMPMPPNRMSMAPTPGNTTSSSNVYNPPRLAEVYTLSDAVNDMIPKDIAEQFHRDEIGRVLFFTSAPLNRPHKGVAPENEGLGHSVHYLAGRKEWLAEREKKRKERDEQHAAEIQKRFAQEGKLRDDEQREAVTLASDLLGAWLQTYDQETAQWKQQRDLDHGPAMGKKEDVSSSS